MTVLKRVMLVVGVLGLAGIGLGGAPGPAAPSVGAGLAAGDELQQRLGATAEEWKVIGVKLRRVAQLRGVVGAAAEGGNVSNPGMMFGAPGMPGSANSMEGAAAQPARGMRGGLVGGMLRDLVGGGGGRGPFVEAPVAARGGRGASPPGGAFGNMLITSQGNPMETLLAELQKMVAEKSTPEAQLKEKLETIRATRRKAKADLVAAREDVVQLLTAKQIATLVALGYLD